MEVINEEKGEKKYFLKELLNIFIKDFLSFFDFFSFVYDFFLDSVNEKIVIAVIIVTLDRKTAMIEGQLFAA